MLRNLFYTFHKQKARAMIILDDIGTKSKSIYDSRIRYDDWGNLASVLHDIDFVYLFIKLVFCIWFF